MEVEEAERGRASGGDGGDSDGSVAGPDRLSSLPDCLLHTIMSLLKARQAVQTCVLSARWRNLWRSVPCLDIDFAEFKTVPVSDTKSSSGSGSDEDSSDSDSNSSESSESDVENSGSDSDSSESSESDVESSGSDSGIHDSDGDSSESDFDSSSSSSSSESSYTSDHEFYGNDKAKYKEWEGFEDFAINLMRGCSIAQLDSFRLHVARSRAPNFGDRQAAGWLRRAMKYCTPDRVPSQHGGGVSSGSWHLKSLHLCNVFLDNGFVTRVNSVCRSLEDLELEDCRCEIGSVTSQSLKTMVLKNCRWRSLSMITSPTLKTLVIAGGSNAHDCVLVILAPAVSYLNLSVETGKFCGGVSINEVPSLAKASIHIEDRGYSYHRSKLDGDQSKLLCSVSNVTSLELAGVGSKVLGKEPIFQKFKNLRNLMLSKCDLSDDFRISVFFLQSSPSLEKLTLQRCRFPKFSNKKKGTPEVNKTSSSTLCDLDLLCENLKVEVLYKHGKASHLVQLLMRISVNLLENNIKLTKVN